MTKTQNLYAEEIIVESPFYYDESGRLRVRVLEESAPMNPMMRKPAPSSPTMRARPDGGIGKLGELQPPAPEDDEEAQTRKEYLAQKKPINRDMRVRSPEEKAFEREREKQKDEEDYQKFKQEKAAKKGAKPLEPVAPKPVKDVQIRNKSDDLIGRPVPPDSAPVKGGAAFGPKLIPGIKPLPSLGRLPPNLSSDREAPPTNDRPRRPMDKSPIDPGMRNRLIAAKDKLRAVGAKPNLDSDEEQPTERPAVAVRKPFKSFRKAQKGPGRNVNTRAGLRGAKPAPKPVAKPMRGKPATRYMEEKIDMEKAEMGEVIRDFQKSDAPQFKGKSKAKRRMMAIAAKLQAERG